ncbi:fumarylacetoacetate hydrolase family protein, partial [Pseudomonadota bacterium]
MTDNEASSASLVFDAPRAVSVAVEGTEARFPVNRIYCVGRNYREHAREMGASLREAPFFFSKPRDAVCEGRTVPYPPMTSNLHHEVELVVALASGGKNLAEDSALSAVFGYS